MNDEEQNKLLDYTPLHISSNLRSYNVPVTIPNSMINKFSENESPFRRINEYEGGSILEIHFKDRLNSELIVVLESPILIDANNKIITIVLSSGESVYSSYKHHDLIRLEVKKGKLKEINESHEEYPF